MPSKEGVIEGNRLEIAVAATCLAARI